MKKTPLILILLLGAVLLSACASGSAAARGSANWPGLTADSESVYVANGSYIHAVNLKDGKELWRYPEGSSNSTAFFAPPVLTGDGQLLAGSEGSDHALYSLDPKTGREKWSKPFVAQDRWIASPLVHGNKIYAPNADGTLYILNMDGEKIDSIELGGSLWSAPATDGQYIYVASLNHYFYVIDAASNKIVETIDIGSAIPGAPAVSPDGIYIGSFSKKLELLKNGDHTTLAEAGNWIWGAPALDGNTLYYADLDGNVYSFDLAGNKQNWSVKPDGPIVASPLVGDQIYVATEAGTVVALDKDGKNVWEREVGGKIYSNLVQAGGLIIVSPVSADVHLAALDADGKLAWTFTPEN